MIRGVVASGFRRASGHRYYRLNISATVSASPAVTEMELRITAGGAQQATGGTASASSVNGPLVAANAFDGSFSTRWQSNSGFPQQLVYDFGAGVTRRIVEYAVATQAGPSSPTAWTLEYSDDNSVWTVCDTRTGQTSWTAGVFNVYTVTSP